MKLFLINLILFCLIQTSVYAQDPTLNLTTESNLVETDANDGYLESFIVISVQDGTFNNPGGNLEGGDDFFISSIPSGISYLLSISNDGASGTLELSGNAYSHQPDNLVSDIEFTFTNSSFIGFSGSDITLETSIDIIFTANAQIVYGNDLDFPTPYQIVNAGSPNESLLLNGLEDAPSGIAFSDDGSKLFVVGFLQDKIVEFDLTAPFDVTTQSISVNSIDLSSFETFPTDLAFGDNGRKLYVVGSSSDNVTQYDLSTAFNLSTAVLNGSLNVSTQDESPSGITFSSDGMRLLVLGDDNDEIFSYDLTTSFDIKTASYSGNSMSLDNLDTNLTGALLSEDGAVLFITGGTSDKVFQIHLNVPGDINSIDLSNVVSNRIDNNPQGLAFDSSGKYLYIANLDEAKIDSYLLSDNVFLESIKNDGSFVDTLTIEITGGNFSNNGGSLNSPEDFTLNLPEGLTSEMLISEEGSIGQLIINGKTTSNLENLNRYLTFEFTDAAFLGTPASTVFGSNKATNILLRFRDNPVITYSSDISLDKSFGVANLKFKGNEQEITEFGDPDTFEISEDGTRVFLGFYQRGIESYVLDVPFDLTTADSKSSDRLELNNELRYFYLSQDGKHLTTSDYSTFKFFELSEEFNLSTATLKGEFNLDNWENQGITSATDLIFSQDGSSLFFSNYSGFLVKVNVNEPFFVQDEDITDIIAIPAGIREFDMSSDGKKIITFNAQGVIEYSLETAYDITSLGFNNKNIYSFDRLEREFDGRLYSREGISYATDDDRIFLLMLTYYPDHLIELEYNSNGFVESDLNDGSLLGEININLQNELFVNAGATLSFGTDYSIENIPEGLIPNLVVSPNGFEATLELTGNATNHSSSKNIDSLIFSFNNSAFENVAAIDIFNSINFNTNLGIRFNPDKTAPSFVMTSDFDSSVSQESIEVTITFSEPVTGFGLDDLAFLEDPDSYGLLITPSLSTDTDSTLFNLSIELSSGESFDLIVNSPFTFFDRSGNANSSNTDTLHFEFETRPVLTKEIEDLVVFNDFNEVTINLNEHFSDPNNDLLLYSFSLIQGTNDGFELNLVEDTLLVISSVNLNSDVTSTIAIEASDGYNQSSENAIFDLKVLYNSPPIFTSGLTYNFSKNNKNGAIVGQVIAEDSDGIGSYSLSDDTGIFDINIVTGVISVVDQGRLNSIDLLVIDSIVVLVYVSDLFEKTKDQEIVIRLNDDDVLAVSLHETKNINGFVVYPNPVEETISIKSNNGYTGVTKITLLDETGREVYKKDIAHFQGVFNLNIANENLNNGIYFLSISDKKTPATYFRLLKK